MIGNPVKIVLSRIVNGTIYSRSTAAVGSRFRVSGVVVRFQRSGSITEKSIGTAIAAILNSLTRIIDKMWKKFARNITVEVDLTNKCISNVYIDGVCFPYLILSMSAYDCLGDAVPKLNITIPSEKVTVRGISDDEYIPKSAEITAPDAYVLLLDENERLKQIIEDQNRKIAILLDT